MPYLNKDTTIVQQDGAARLAVDDRLCKLNMVGREGGWKIKLVTQPAHSPDLNVNYLGFYTLLESRVWTERYESIDDMVAGVPVMAPISNLRTNKYE